MPGKSKKSIPEIAISEFKAKCLSLLEQVNKTKTPLRVTRRGRGRSGRHSSVRGFRGKGLDWLDVRLPRNHRRHNFAGH